MIEQGVCKYCSEGLRANGEEKFRGLVENHFKVKHNKAFKDLSALRETAQKEFEELRGKYPELVFGFSYFDIDYGKLLSKPQEVN